MPAASHLLSIPTTRVGVRGEQTPPPQRPLENLHRGDLRRHLSRDIRHVLSRGHQHLLSADGRRVRVARTLQRRVADAAREQRGVEWLLRDETGGGVGSAGNHRHRRRLQHLCERRVEVLHARAYGCDDFRILTNVLEGLARKRGAIAEENDAREAGDQLHVLYEAQLRGDEACEEL